MSRNISWLRATPICIAVSLAGCSEPDNDSDVDSRNAEIVANLLEAGYEDEHIEIREGEPQPGVIEDMVFVDHDVHVTLETSRLALEHADDEYRHWRTPYLVGNNRLICLGQVTTAATGYTSYILTSAMQGGVATAKNNYNGIGGVGLDFKVVNANVNSSGYLNHSDTSCASTIWIYKVTNPAGGQSGFPNGDGHPYPYVQLFSGLSGYSAGVHAFVATHEVGHAIGLRHADWKTRSSCGQNTNEGQSGASLISGTPDQTTTSIMKSCFNGSESGGFLGSDVTALDTIY
jgi:hypothetical protein